MSIGYACIVESPENIRFKSCTLKNATDEKLRSLTLYNLSILDQMIDYNIKNNIHLFRIGSEVIPFASHPINTQQWWREHKSTFEYIGSKIQKGNVRVSMHVGQYTIINSPNDDVVENSIQDLVYHARFLDTLGVDATSKIVIHIGGVYGDKKASIQRFIDNFITLPQNIKNRLVIENDEKSYTIEDVLSISNTLNIPVVFDNLHHRLNLPSIARTDTEWLMLCNQTWGVKDGKQKIHYSQQSLSGRAGSHSLTIAIDEFLRYYKEIGGQNIDIMLEVKDKNLSALKCIHCTWANVPLQYIEEEWAKYKYVVLSHSHPTYLEIGELFREDTELLSLQFYRKVEFALSTPSTMDSEVNALSHVWGYFKDISSPKEKEKFKRLLENFEGNKSSITSVKNFLYRLAQQYDVVYLLPNYYFIL